MVNMLGNQSFNDKSINELNKKSENLRRYRSQNSPLNLIQLNVSKESSNKVIVDPLGAYLKDKPNENQKVNPVNEIKEVKEKLFDYKPFNTPETKPEENDDEHCECEVCNNVDNEEDYDSNEESEDHESDVSYESDESVVDNESQSINITSFFNALTTKVTNSIEITGKIKSATKFTSDKFNVFTKQIKNNLPTSLSHQKLKNKIKSSISGYAFNHVTSNSANNETVKNGIRSPFFINNSMSFLKYDI
jgi:hypothetical protein